MAHKQGSERGFAQVGASMLLALFASLLPLSGCSSGGVDDAALESVNSTEQGITCLCPKGNGCIVSYTCNTLTGTCDPNYQKDFTACNGGACISGVCCTGCYFAARGGGYTCDPGTSATRCGTGADKCTTCNDSNSCTTDVCTAGKCDSQPVADKTACSDGVLCNGDEACVSGVCTTPPSFSCDDKNPCTADACDETSGCTSSPLSGISCSDGNKCNGDEQCSAGVCGSGTSLNCDDKNPCTADSCDPAGGCMHDPVKDGTQCDDANVCNGIAQCSGGACKVPTVGLNCDDGEVCTDDTCDAVAGCKHSNNAKGCSDNSLCTTNDTCSGGKCVGGAAPNCDDNETCTTDSCSPALGCQHAAVLDTTACNDGNSCTTVDKCASGKCVGTGGPTCDDNDPCTKNACDVATQVCTNPAATDGVACVFDKCHQNSACSSGKCSAGTVISCDDNNPCTKDSCDPAVGCAHVQDNLATCSDGDACTKGDACKAGKCVGTATTCSPLDSCHQPGTCAPTTGICDDPRSEDESACPGGTCQTGKCIPSGDAGATGSDGGAAGETSTGGAAPSDAGAAGETATGGKDASGGSYATGGKGGSSVGGGDEIPPDQVFTRNPGGCACGVPRSTSNHSGAWLALLGAVGVVTLRRRRRAA